MKVLSEQDIIQELDELEEALKNKEYGLAMDITAELKRALEIELECNRTNRYPIIKGIGAVLAGLLLLGSVVLLMLLLNCYAL